MIVAIVARRRIPAFPVMADNRDGTISVTA